MLKRKRSSVTAPRGVGEWVGARRVLPPELADEDDDGDTLPHVVIWLEVGRAEPVALVAIDDADPADAALVILEAAMREPAHGPPRRPARVRVDDHALAELLRTRLADIEVAVGLAPEIDAVLARLVQDR